MAKTKTKFVCQNCGNIQPRWIGKCPSCGEWNTFEEELDIALDKKTFSLMNEENNKSVTLSEVVIDNDERVKTGFEEIDRVLGGGFIKGEAVLMSGEPGIGKSTVLMQVCNFVSKDSEVLYVSGEESISQIASRARRIISNDLSQNIKLFSNGNVEHILHQIDSTRPKVIVVDSIQTIWDSEATGLPGGISQVRATAVKLIRLVKELGIIMILVGHINKEGKIAGPKVLEHLVDCVLQLEGHRSGEYRILRSLKNRFGSTGEVGLLQMDENGLADGDNINGFLIENNNEKEIGVAKTFITEGSRAIALEIQSLSVKSVFSLPKRVGEGLNLNRMQLLTAIIENKKILNLFGKDLYCRIAGGYSLREYTYADLAVIASLISAAKSKPLTQKRFFLGEVTLNGNVYLPQFMHRFVNEILRIYPGSEVVSNFSAASKKLPKSCIHLDSIAQLVDLIN